MEQQQHKLIEIPHSDWPELRDLFLVNWPEHILGYSIVNNLLELQTKSGPSGIRSLKFYALDGDWKSDGTFLAIVGVFGLFLIICVILTRTVSLGFVARTGTNCSFTASKRTRKVIRNRLVWKLPWDSWTGQMATRSVRSPLNTDGR